MRYWPKEMNDVEQFELPGYRLTVKMTEEDASSHQDFTVRKFVLTRTEPSVCLDKFIFILTSYSKSNEEFDLL